MVKKSLLVLLAIVVVGLSCLAVRDFRPYPRNLGDYLQDLFVSNGVAPNQDDFFEPVEDPYLAFAKMLNLVSTSAQSDDRIGIKKAKMISEQFLTVKDNLYLDGLYG